MPSKTVSPSDCLCSTYPKLANLTSPVKEDNAVAADVPLQVGKVSFVFQRGGSLQYTDAADVDTERKAYWNQVLKLVRDTSFWSLESLGL